MEQHQCGDCRQPGAADHFHVFVKARGQGRKWELLRPTVDQKAADAAAKEWRLMGYYARVRPATGVASVGVPEDP